jgi:hypothetical protein
MQQLQCKGLQLQAWRHQHAAAALNNSRPAQRRHASSSAACNPLLEQRCRTMPAQPDLQLPSLTRGCLRIKLRSSSVCSSTAGDTGGDAVRPSAQAATPAASVDVTGAVGAASSGSSNAAAKPGSSSDGGSSSSSSASGTSSGSGYSSYSDMYKSLHNTFNSQPGALQSSLSSQKQEHQQRSGVDGSSGSDSSHGNGHQANSSSSSDGSSAHAAAEALLTAAGLAEPAAAASAAAPSPAAAAGVEDALKKAQRALAAAESSLGSIHKLRSAQPPNKWTGLLQILRSVAVVAAAASALVASHAFGLGWQWAGATLGALGLAGTTNFVSNRTGWYTGCVQLWCISVVAEARYTCFAQNKTTYYREALHTSDSAAVVLRTLLADRSSPCLSVRQG